MNVSTPAAGHNTIKLAIDGGEPIRSRPMPARFALGEAEIAQVHQVIAYYQEKQVDPGYSGPFEKNYTDAFVKFMGGGYADAVATGTASLYIAIAALNLPPESEVIVSPITDPGTVSPIILNRLVPRVADSEPGTFNMGPEQFVARITPKTRAVMLVHSLGRAADVIGVVKEARARGIHVIEDCSQSHGALGQGPADRQFRRHRRVLDHVPEGARHRRLRRRGVQQRYRSLSSRACSRGSRKAVVAARFRRPQSEPVPVSGA